MVQLQNIVKFQPLSNFERELFQNSSPKQLSNVVVEHAAQTLLVCRRFGDETAKGVPIAEFERLKKELADSAQTLEATLNANTSLTKKMKGITNVHSQCGPMKESLETKIEDLTNEHGRLMSEMENICQELTRMTISYNSNQGRREKDEKEVEVAQQYVLEQHKLGFTKALQQAEYFYKIPIHEGNFDVMKDFHKGQLMPIGEIPNDDEDENEDIAARNNDNREDNELVDID